MALAYPEKNTVVTVAPYDMNAYSQVISAFLEASPREDRLQAAIRLFLDQPYQLEPLGEGPEGIYSQEPLYRTDQFDCVTYVDTVLALLHARNLETFEQSLLRVRYENARLEYTARTDWFTDLEWIPNSQRLGWIQDVTEQIVDHDGHSIAKMAKTLIDKPNWYQRRPPQAMHFFAPGPDKQQAKTLLQSLHASAEWFSVQPSTLSYLPLDRLFDADRQPDTFLFDQIPSGSVVFIVRPDWAIRDTFDRFPGYPNGYGTNLNVSHLGFVLRTADGLMFYNASSLHGKVEAEPLAVYLAKSVDSPTIKGIHVEKII